MKEAGELGCGKNHAHEREVISQVSHTHKILNKKCARAFRLIKKTLRRESVDYMGHVRYKVSVL